MANSRKSNPPAAIVPVPGGKTNPAYFLENIGETLAKQRRTTPSPKRPKGVPETHIHCEACHEWKAVGAFYAVGRTPTIRKEICLICTAAQKTERLKRAVEDRAVDNLAAKLHKSEATQARSRRKKTKVNTERQAKAKAKAKETYRKQLVSIAGAEAAKQEKKAVAVALTEAERKLAERIMSRRRLIHFITHFKQDYQAGWVHKDICNRLEKFFQDVQDKKSPRLMLFMPPRHGKSEIASVRFPAFVLGHRPDFEIIASSYAVSLPIGFSRKVQDMLMDTRYKQLFPETAMSKRSQSAEAWLTTKGGGYVAAGVGGGITGKGAHILIIDDPVKDAEEADSETIRERNWDWWGSTAKTRLAPGGGVLVILTRWHDADLAGKMLTQRQEQNKELDELIHEQQELLMLAPTAQDRKDVQKTIDAYEAERNDIDQWEVVSYPAIATDDEWLNAEGQVIRGEDLKVMYDEEVYKTQKLKIAVAPHATFDHATLKLLRHEGEALHPDRFPIGRLKNMKRTMQPRHWSALYQQNPVPDEGVYFTKDMFRFEPTVVDYREMYVFTAWDLAIGQKQTNDWTVGVVGALDWNDNVHIIDIVRGRWDTHQIVEAFLDVCEKYSPMLAGIEKGQLEHAIRPQLMKRMAERRLYPTLAEKENALMPITDKLVRGRPLQGRMQQGMVYFPANQPWTETAQHELLRFPGGVHDDIVDGLAWLVRMMLKHQAPPPPGGRNRIKHKSWKDKLNAIASSQDRGKHPMLA